MKLLSRKTVSNEASEQKRQSIEEGLQIARKVDKLRETLASLEKQHSDFMNGIQSELKKKSENLLNEIALKQLDIVQLDEKRKALLRPLNAEWDEVKAEKVHIAETRDILAKGLIKLSDKEKKAQDNYEDSKNTKARINVRERELLRVYELNKENGIITEKTKNEALEKMAKIDLYISEKLKELVQEENRLKEKEVALEITSQKIVDDRNNLLEKETLLKDREETLERELQRRKK